jgi:hypothetical protein
MAEGSSSTGAGSSGTAEEGSSTTGEGTDTDPTSATTALPPYGAPPPRQRWA